MRLLQCVVVLLLLSLAAAFEARRPRLGVETGDGPNGKSRPGFSRMRPNLLPPRDYCRLVANKTGLAADAIPADCSVALVSGGSFIQLSHAMAKAPGVAAVLRGYAGGYARRPTYEKVCQGRTGHAEAVMVAFDQAATNLTEIYRYWLQNHDCSVEGAMTAVIDDTNYYGPQYRSVAFVRDRDDRIAFRNAVRQYRQETNATIASRALLFAGRFVPENATDDALIAIRRRVNASGTNDTYVRKRKTAGVTAKFEEKQKISEDDAIAKELEQLDKEGKLAGAAVRKPKTKPTAAKPAPANAEAKAAEGNATIAEPPATTGAVAATEAGTKEVASVPDVPKTDAVAPPPAPTEAPSTA